MSLLDQARAQMQAAVQQREQQRLRQLGQTSTTPRLSPEARRERRSAPQGTASSSSSSGKPSKRKRWRLESGSATTATTPKSAPGSIAKRAATHKNFMHEDDFLETATPIVMSVTAHPVTHKSGLAGWAAEVTTRRVYQGSQTFRVQVDFKARVFDPRLNVRDLDPLALDLTLRPARIGPSAIGWASKGKATAAATADPQGHDYKFLCSAKVVQPRIILNHRNQPKRQSSAAAVVDQDDDAEEEEEEEEEETHHGAAVLRPPQAFAASPQVPQHVNRPVVINADAGRRRVVPSRDAARYQSTPSDDDAFADADDDDHDSADESNNDHRYERQQHHHHRSRPRSPAVGARRYTRDHDDDVRTRRPNRNDRGVDRGFDADTEPPPPSRSHNRSDRGLHAVDAADTVQTPQQDRRSRHVGGGDSGGADLDDSGFIDPEAVKHLPDVADEECDDGPNTMFVWNLLVHFVLMIVLAGLFLLVALHEVSLLQRLEDFLQLQGFGLSALFGSQSANAHGGGGAL